MTPPKKRHESLVERIGLELQLIPRLYMDRRMPFWLKLVPLAGLGYLVNPVDFPSLLDDLLVLLISAIVFFEFAPTRLVEEHREALRNLVDAEWREAAPDEDIIDGQFKQGAGNNGDEGEKQS